ncbi:GAF domain-containing sensor histidine kinase [Hamadaea tsunoensis]|uniref:GAF domain-containing sensor histidine kinase n=1 Tax=Hamadaea tsunoensis TaxID=53368 RepID=UPI00041C5725|nr:GAF domain-containing sensor histidine kinase [Hamadaea tsunoensis]
MDDRSTLDELSAAVLAVNRHLSVREVLQTIVSAAQTLLGARYAALGVPDDQGGFAEFVVAGVSDEQREKIGPLPRQHGILAAMLTEAGPQRLADIRRDPRFGWWPAAHPVLKGFLGRQITDGRSVLGALFLANKIGGEFTDADERLLGVLAAHAAIALTNARLYEQSRELTLLEERQRVARELHDAVAQKLFSLRLTTEAATAWVRRDPARAETELQEIRWLAAQATEELGQIVAELRPRELVDTGLAETLRRRVALLDRVHDAAVSFSTTLAGRPAPAVEEAVLRIVEEALHNALRHANAGKVAVTLAGPPLTCVVADDGTGFDTAAADSASLGLASMRERARRLGGTLAVDSGQGGTVVTLTVPS